MGVFLWTSRMPENIVAFAGLFSSAFISATLAPGGSEAVLAYLVAVKQLPVIFLLMVATLGNTLGSMTTWLLGILAAKKLPVAVLLTKKQQNGLDFIQKYGYWAFLFSWLPVVGDAFCFAGGWLKLPFLPSCLLIFLGKLSRYAVIAWMFS